MSGRNDIIDLVEAVCRPGHEAECPSAQSIAQLFTEQGRRAAWIGQDKLVTVAQGVNSAHELAERAHAVAATLERDQLITVTGFEGSYLNKAVDVITKSLLDAGQSPIADSVQAAETVIMAFAHADTSKQPSAPCFAALREFALDSQGRVTGWGFMPTMLDSNRLVHVSNREHSFNVFYYLLSGASRSERDALGVLPEGTDYTMLGDTCSTRDALTDCEHWNNLNAALRMLDFKASQIQAVHRLLSAMLLLGNVRFDDVSGSNKRTAAVSDFEILTAVASLLGVEPDDLEQSLVNKLFWNGNDLTSIFLDSRQALAQVHRLTTALYEVLFAFVVEKANYKLMAPQPLTTVLLLAISGIRTQETPLPLREWDFRTNCANELVDQCLRTSSQSQDGTLALTTPTFSLISHISDKANHLARRFGVADHEDEQFLRTMSAPPAANLSLTVSLEQRAFSVQHFSGTATYDARGFVQSERNLVDLQWIDLLRHSSDAFIVKLWSGPSLSVETHPSDPNAVVEAQISSIPLRRAALEPDQAQESLAIRCVSTQIEEVVRSWTSLRGNAQVWRVICLAQPERRGASKNTPSLRQQLDVFAIPQLVRASQQSWVIEMTATDFQKHYDSIQALEHCVSGDYKIDGDRVWLTWDAFNTLNRQRGSPRSDRTLALSEAQQIARAARDPFSAAEASRRALPASSDYASSETLDVFEKLQPEALGSTGPTVKAKKDKVVEEVATSRARRVWVAMVWALTWWIPSFMLSSIGRMKRPDVRMAWREKFALCILIAFFCGTVIFYVIIFGRLLCPNIDKAWNVREVGYHTGTNDFYVSVRGVVYDLTKFYKVQHSDVIGMDSSRDLMLQLAGQDLSQYFPLPLDVACSSLRLDPALSLVYKNFTPAVSTALHTSGRLAVSSQSALYNPRWYWEDFLPRMRGMAKGPLVWPRRAISDEAGKAGRRWAIYDAKVYDLEEYLSTIETYPSNDAYKFLNNDLSNLWQSSPGSDITLAVRDLGLNDTTLSTNFECISTLFYRGELDFRKSPKCQVQPFLLLGFAIIIFLVLLAKFLASLQLSSKRMPELRDKFVICQVPAYTEGEESLRKTIDSLATLTYDDRRKLILIICDGQIVGRGNDRPTPDMVLDILGADRRYDPEALLFKSVAEGSKQLNFGKVWSGLYQTEGHVVPYIVVVKVGRPTERYRPGNRGKRDSQVMLMRFLNRAHNDGEMYPLELEMMHHFKNVIGIDPRAYEFMLVIDADTSVQPDSLNRLVSSCIDDSKIIGICGETRLENEKKTWWTMIQVYEYYISQFMAKAFESLFGCVTCLPGCFTMYRLRSPDGLKSLLVHSSIVDDYSVNELDTLHKKNLLLLGEDRYLTTLILKHFPHYKTKFNGEAKASTLAPDSLSILVSQRRRWINSTVHNLVELVTLSDLCGFCCFSMRFVVILDLVGTLILPATFAYLVYLIVTVAAGKSAVPYISLGMIAAVYGLQAVLFLLRRQWQLIGWLVIYIIAYPIYSFILPIYSFWRFDDFTWGQTRVVIGEGKSKKIVSNEDEVFDESTLPLAKFAEYEAALMEESRLSKRASAATFPSMQMPVAPLAAGSAHQRNTSSATSLPRSLLGSPTLPATARTATQQHLRRDSQATSLSFRDPFTPGISPNPFSDSRRASQMTFDTFAATDYFSQPRRGSGYAASPLATAAVSTPLFLNDSKDVTREDLIATLKAFLATQDLMTVTRRGVRDQLNQMFPNADLAGRKDEINSLIDGILDGSL